MALIVGGTAGLMAAAASESPRHRTRAAATTPTELSRLATILAADVVGCSRLTEREGAAQRGSAN